MDEPTKQDEAHLDQPVAATESASSVAASKPLADQYDIGDTSLGSPPATEPVEAEPPQQAPVSRKRGPDGKFLPSSSPEAAVTHSRHLVQMAKELGFSDQEIQETPTDRLQENVFYVNRQALAEARRVRQDGLSTEPFDRSITDKPVSTSQQQIQKEDEDDLGLGDEADYAPGIVQALKKLSAQNRALREQLSQVAGVQQRNIQRTVAQRADSVFASRPDLFGKDGRASIRKDGPEYQRRMAALAVAERMEGPLEDRLQRAIDTVFGTPRAATTHDEPAPDEQEWNNSVVARPTQRGNAREEKGYATAVKNVARKMREQGLLEDQNTEFADGFLE